MSIVSVCKLEYNIDLFSKPNESPEVPKSDAMNKDQFTNMG